MNRYLAFLLVVSLGSGLVSCKISPQRPSAPDYQMEYVVEGVSFSMVKLPAGSFTMGISSDNRRAVKGGVAQEVALDGFVITEKPVSQALWTAVMGKNPSSKANPDLPVDWVSWDDVMKFISKLNKYTGKTFLLPTEAQWEYAINRFEGQGSSILEEWCFDPFSSAENGYFNPSILLVNPTGPEKGDQKVVRTFLTRSPLNRKIKREKLGFRLVQPTEETFPEQLLEVLNGNTVNRDPVDASREITETIEVNGVSFKMVQVAGGTFEMGYTATDHPGGSRFEIPENEQPAHKVTLDDFALGETEVTVGLWRAVMGSVPYLNDMERPRTPVGNVSWYDCQDFLQKLNGLTGRKFRLPTEAEWEYAARGGRRSSHTPFSGSAFVGQVAVYSSTAGGAKPRTEKVVVKSLRPNELGFYDMSGNVWEWCHDRYAEYSAADSVNPVGAAEGGNRIMRGGSYASPWTACRVSNRSSIPAVNVKGSFGLRLAL